MNKQYLYNTLKEIRSGIESIGIRSCAALDKIDDLILKAKNDLLMETKTTSKKSRITYCSNYAKKIRKSYKPMLGYSTIINNKQVYTDGYFLVSLGIDDIIETIPDQEKEREEKDQGCAYPILTSIVNDLNKSYENMEQLEVKEVINAKKLKQDTIELKSGIRFSIKNLYNLIMFMNYDIDETICFTFDKEFTYKPVLVKRGESSGFILPLRY